MKICFAVDKIPKYKIGGAERQFFLIGQELSRRGHEVHITCRRFDENQPQIEVVDGLTVHTFGPKPQSTEEIREFLQTKLEFLAALRDADCDIYHNTPASPLTGWTRLFTKITGRPFAFTLAHENDYTRSYWAERSYRRRWLYYYGLKNADRRVVLAEYMQKGLDEEFDLESEVIRYGYPIPPEFSFERKEKRVIWLARMVDWKRPELFIELADRIDLEGWTFHLIGFADDEGYYEKLKRQSEPMENLYFEGPVDPGDDMEWYRQARLFVNTSTAEGFPNSYIQSWIHGTPVAALEVDPDHLIRENNAGLHCSDFDEFVMEVEELLSDTERLEKLGENARQLGLAFDIERTASKYLNLYEELVG